MPLPGFQPGEGPSRGLLGDHEPSDGPSSSSSVVRSAADTQCIYISTISTISTRQYNNKPSPLQLCLRPGPRHLFVCGAFQLEPNGGVTRVWRCHELVTRHNITQLEPLFINKFVCLQLLSNLPSQRTVCWWLVGVTWGQYPTSGHLVRRMWPWNELGQRNPAQTL